MKKLNTVQIGAITFLASSVITFMFYVMDLIVSYSIFKIFPFFKGSYFETCHGIGFIYDCRLSIAGYLLIDLIIYTVLAIIILGFVRLKRK